MQAQIDVNQVFSQPLSHTLFVTEKATTLFQDLAPLDPTLFTKRGWWLTGNWGDTLMTTMYPINTFDKIALAAGSVHTYSASSLHPGGVNALMGDGSVKFIKETIQSWPNDTLLGMPTGATRNPGGWWENVPRGGVWQALGSRSGGEVIDPSAY